MVAGFVVLILGWIGLLGRSAPEPSTLGTATPGSDLPTAVTPTRTPLETLPDLGSPAPEVTPTPTTGSFAVPPGLTGTGYTHSLPQHRVVLTAGTDGQIYRLGWRVPLADGSRGDISSTPKSNPFRHVSITYGAPDYAQLHILAGPYARRTWCTITVDGKVTDHREAKGPWASLYCQG